MSLRPYYTKKQENIRAEIIGRMYAVFLAEHLRSSPSGAPVAGGDLCTGLRGLAVEHADAAMVTAYPLEYSEEELVPVMWELVSRLRGIVLRRDKAAHLIAHATQAFNEILDILKESTSNEPPESP